MSSRGFGRAFLVTTLLAMLVVGARPAFAKFENATITIAGPGLDMPIQLAGNDAVLWERYSGVFEQKWAAPNIQGEVSPGANLGPGYQVDIAFDCGDSGTQAFAETLYPYAPGGPQISTGPDVRFCGMAASSGYFPASVRLLHALVSAGLPRTAPEVRAVPAIPTSSGGSASTTIALVGLFALAVAAGVTGLRQRGHPTP